MGLIKYLVLLALISTHFAKKAKNDDDDDDEEEVKPRRKKKVVEAPPPPPPPPPPPVPKRKPPRTLQIGVLKDGKVPNCTNFVEVGDEVEVCVFFFRFIIHRENRFLGIFRCFHHENNWKQLMKMNPLCSGLVMGKQLMVLRFA